MPEFLQYLMKFISPTPHFVIFAQDVLLSRRGCFPLSGQRSCDGRHWECLFWFCFAPLPPSHFQRLSQMAKDKQKKHEAAGATAASGKMKRKEFEKELAKLQVELTRLQTWVKDKGARLIIVFEGRDTAGKGGVISRITARTSPRIYRHVALPTPSDREKTQIYMQRYIAQFPAAGEIILFDRSWYNRAGVSG